MTLPGWLTGFGTQGRPYEATGAWAIYSSHITDYMHRWILRTPRGTVRLHRILRADRGYEHHDHPFDFESLILSGGYDEELLEADARRVTFFGPGDVVERSVDQAHRIVRVRPWTWTFVVTGPKRKAWGFYTRRGWVYWRDYHRVY